MSDVHDEKTRSRNMSAIKAVNTKPEMIIRKMLHQSGFRFKLHDKSLPGKPDVVLPKYNAIILIHGCFWHGHNNCHLFSLPKTRVDFWLNKITANQKNDLINKDSLLLLGKRVLTIWECSLKGKKKLDSEFLKQSVCEWLCSISNEYEITGNRYDCA